MNNKDLRKERKKHRRQENRNYILEAAEKVFANKGYSSATVDDIAEEAQFSKATIYSYFKSKSDIFMEVIYSAVEESYKEIDNVQRKKLSAEEKIKEIIFTIVSFYHRKKNIARIFFMEKSAMKKIMSASFDSPGSSMFYHPKIPSKFVSKMRQISDVISEIIKKGVKSGEFRDVDVQDAGFVLGAMLRGFYFRGPLVGKEYSIQETTDLLYSYFLYGIKKRQNR